MSKDSQKVSSIVNAVVNDAIETPMSVLIERTEKCSKDEILERYRATMSEMIKLQYRLREYSIVDWYKNELDDLRRNLHDVFEKNRDFFKAGSKGDNWLLLSNVNIERVNELEEFNDGENVYYFAYFSTQDKVNECIDNMRKKDTYKVLCVPLFKSV